MKKSWFINATLILINSASLSNVLKSVIPFSQKLLELNNLHSLMSVVSALQSAPIFRLTKTWAVSAALTLVPSVLLEFWGSLEFVIFWTLEENAFMFLFLWYCGSRNSGLLHVLWKVEFRLHLFSCKFPVFLCVLEATGYMLKKTSVDTECVSVSPYPKHSVSFNSLPKRKEKSMLQIYVC